MGFWSSIFDTPAKGQHRKPAAKGKRTGTQKAATVRSSRAVGVAKAPPGSVPQRTSRGRQRAAQPGARLTPSEYHGRLGFTEHAPRKSPRDRFAGVTSDRRMDERLRHTRGSQMFAGGPPLMGSRQSPAPRPAAAPAPSWFGSALWRPAPRTPAVGRARRPATAIRNPYAPTVEPVAAESRYPRQTGRDFAGHRR